MKILVFVLIFLIIGALLILSNHNLPLYKEENIIIFKGLYLDWLGSIYENAAFITGNVIDMKWLPNKKI
jgi:hypothetical protein